MDYLEEFGGLDDNGMIDGVPGEDFPIICPFCRQPDSRFNNCLEVPDESKANLDE